MRNSIKSTPRSLTFLLFGILSLLLLGFLIKEYPPTFFVTFFSFHISVIIFFFVLLFFGISGIVGFIFKSKLQGIVVSLFLMGFLILKLLALTNWFFVGLLFVLFIITELFLIKAK